MCSPSTTASRSPLAASPRHTTWGAQEPASSALHPFPFSKSSRNVRPHQNGFHFLSRHLRRPRARARHPFPSSIEPERAAPSEAGTCGQIIYFIKQSFWHCLNPVNFRKPTRETSLQLNLIFPGPPHQNGSYVLSSHPGAFKLSQPVTWPFPNKRSCAFPNGRFPPRSKQQSARLYWRFRSCRPLAPPDPSGCARKHLTPATLLTGSLLAPEESQQYKRP